MHNQEPISAWQLMPRLEPAEITNKIKYILLDGPARNFHERYHEIRTLTIDYQEIINGQHIDALINNLVLLYEREHVFYDPNHVYGPDYTHPQALLLSEQFFLVRLCELATSKKSELNIRTLSTLIFTLPKLYVFNIFGNQFLNDKKHPVTVLVHGAFKRAMSLLEQFKTNKDINLTTFSKLLYGILQYGHSLESFEDNVKLILQKTEGYLEEKSTKKFKVDVTAEQFYELSKALDALDYFGWTQKSKSVIRALQNNLFSNLFHKTKVSAKPEDFSCIAQALNDFELFFKHHDFFHAILASLVSAYPVALAGANGEEYLTVCARVLRYCVDKNCPIDKQVLENIDYKTAKILNQTQDFQGERNSNSHLHSDAKLLISYLLQIKQDDFTPRHLLAILNPSHEDIPKHEKIIPSAEKAEKKKKKYKKKKKKNKLAIQENVSMEDNNEHKGKKQSAGGIIDNPFYKAQMTESAFPDQTKELKSWSYKTKETPKAITDKQESIEKLNNKIYDDVNNTKSKVTTTTITWWGLKKLQYQEKIYEQKVKLQLLARRKAHQIKTMISQLYRTLLPSKAHETAQLVRKQQGKKRSYTRREQLQYVGWRLVKSPYEGTEMFLGYMEQAIGERKALQQLFHGTGAALFKFVVIDLIRDRVFDKATLLAFIMEEDEYSMRNRLVEAGMCAIAFTFLYGKYQETQNKTALDNNKITKRYKLS